MRISASIVLYRHSHKQVGGAIDSFLACEYVRKLILVDNGGSGWAAELAHPRVEYTNPGRNLGYGGGHNVALRLCRNIGTHHVVSNPDLTFTPGTLEKIYRYADSTGAGLVMPDVRYPTGERQYFCKLLPTPTDLIMRRFLPALNQTRRDRFELRNADYTRDFFVPYLSGSFMFLSNDAITYTNGFDENIFMYLEDTDLTRRIARKFSTRYFPGARVTHRFEQGSYKSLKLLAYHIRSAIYYFHKWGWFFDKERDAMNVSCLQSLPLAGEMSASDAEGAA
jgi:GT2 family glycosyltransferase